MQDNLAASLLRQFIGFGAHAKNGTYPPYNIVRIDDGTVEIEVATAGFDESELDVSVESSKLVLTGRKSESRRSDAMVYQGISEKSFRLEFSLGKSAEVKSASYANGILTVLVKSAVREESKKISINRPEESRQVLME
jgi:molecular chaperone IbpA